MGVSAIETAPEVSNYKGFFTPPHSYYHLSFRLDTKQPILLGQEDGEEPGHWPNGRLAEIPSTELND